MAATASAAARRLIHLLDRVLVERAVKETRTASGILLPETAGASLKEGVVVAIGPGRRTVNGDLVAPTLAVGDRVVLPEFGGMGMKVEGKDMVMLGHDEIIAKYE